MCVYDALKLSQLKQPTNKLEEFRSQTSTREYASVCVCVCACVSCECGRHIYPLVELAMLKLYYGNESAHGVGVHVCSYV